MKRNILILLAVLTSLHTYGQCTLSSYGTTVSSLVNSNWGQSFVPTCSDSLQSITFNAAASLTTPTTLTIRDGQDCNATILHTQPLNAIIDGNNTIVLTTPLQLTQGNTYYFSVKTVNETGWQIRFSPTNQIAGNLRTYLVGDPGSTCDRNFPNFDWNYSLTIGDTTTVVTPEVIDLFIWAGQSNAQGWAGDAAQYPPDPLNLDKDIRLNYELISTSSSNGWITMQPQIGRYPAGHFGPEVSFSRLLKTAGYNPAIFKFTKPGTSVYIDWKTPGAGAYYDYMIPKLNTAISDLENLGHTVNIRGFIWIQGESDGKDSLHANAYQAGLSAILSDIRTVTNDSLLPIVLGVDEQHPWIVNFPIVLGVHHNAAANDCRIEFTSMLGLPKADATHLTPAGLVLHGEVVYDAMTYLIDSSAVACSDPLTFDIKVLLEGAYNPASGTMTKSLFQLELLPGMLFSGPSPGIETPAGQPYHIAPWNYQGTEGQLYSNSHYHPTSVDWVLLSLRTGVDPSTEIYKTAGILKADGSVDFLPDTGYSGSIPGPYYVLIEHRNHIGVLSPQAVSSQNRVLTYDFTTQNSWISVNGGFGQKQLSDGSWAMFAGDGDQIADMISYDINGADRILWGMDNGIFMQYLPSDYNLDGEVTGADKILWGLNTGISSGVPK